MNTPAHAVANLLLLGRMKSPELVTPIALGAVIPDLPMFVFYVVEKIGRGLPEQEIWSQAYFSPAWQDFFDLFNSFPITLLVMLIARALGHRWIFMLAASMTLHGLFDLPLHVDDGHRHFFPLSDFRFASPVSYWDPAHHGRITAPLEAIGTLIGCAVLFARYESRRLRAAMLAIGALYLAYLAFALVKWVE